MHMKHLGTINSSFKHNTRETRYERETLLIENQASIEMDQIKKHNINSYILMATYPTNKSTKTNNKTIKPKST